MIVFKLILFTLFISVRQCRIPDKVYCANQECDGPISKARTLISYTSADPDLISFPGKTEAIVFMKSAGTNPDLWFATINGNSGFVNSKFIRENKIIEKKLQVVPYEAKNQANVQPDKVQQPHEVFEGTTIYTTEAAVNAAQQDSSTESPITSSNEDLTPTLDSATGTTNQNVDNNIRKVPSQDNNEVKINSGSQPDDTVNSESPNNEEPSTTPPEILKEGEVVTSDANQSMESSTETISKAAEETPIENSEQSEPAEQQVEQEVPKKMPSDTLPLQQIFTSASGTLDSESAIEMPEKKDYLQNTLAETEKTDTKDQNTSTLNNNAENVQMSQVTSSETNNVPNGNSFEEPVVNPTDKPTGSPINEPAVSSITKPEVHSMNGPLPLENEPLSTEPIVNPKNEPTVPLKTEPVPPLNQPVVKQIQNIIPPILTNINLGNQHNVPPNFNVEPNTATPEKVSPSPTTEPFPTIAPIPAPSTEIPAVQVENVPSTTEPFPTIAPLPTPSTEIPAVQVENVPPTTEPFPTIAPLPTPSTEIPAVQDENVPPTTEKVPPLYSEEVQTVPIPETIPSTMNMEAPPITEIPPQGLPPLYTYTTTPAPYNSDDTNSRYSTSESTSTEDTYSPPEMDVEDIIAALPDSPEDINTVSTEAPVQDENTEGFFSNMYSSVADIWPSSTESPEPLYNTEYPTYESEKADGDEVFSFMKYALSTYYSIMGTNKETKALFASVGETCFTDEYCDGTSNDGTNRLLTFLLTTASSVLLFTLGYYYIDNRRQDGRLIGTINSLQRDLLFTTKECEILKEELATTKNKLAGIEDSSFGMDDMVQSLKEEISELKATNDRLRNSLDDNEKLLRVSENTAGELQNTLGEVENTLSELLAERANSEEQIVELNGKIQAFEEEFISVSRDRDNFQLKYVSAETALEEFKKQKKHFEDLNQQLAEAKNTVEVQKHEIEALKDAIKELKSGMSADVDVTSFIDHTEIKAKLSKALQERNSYETKFETEYKERTRLVEELKTTQETLTTTSQSATEALTRLEVLGKYFQERESELLKELSAKESLWLSKQGESTSTVEKIELLQQEVQRYKEKCDALTLELAEQESSRRSALSEVEARAHGAWLEARAARRDADAARDDAAALRRKLASLSAADGAVSPHHKVSSPLDSMENPIIPPPLPPMFLPPPLLPPLPRPPPLGRLPSPHPPRYGDRRYSPDSRYSPESRYSPDSRYSPETVRYSPDSRYSPRSRRSPYSPRSRRRSRSRERYEETRVTRSRNGPAPPPDTETEYNSDSPTRQPRRRGRYSRHSGPSSGSGCSSESDK